MRLAKIVAAALVLASISSSQAQAATRYYYVALRTSCWLVQCVDGQTPMCTAVRFLCPDNRGAINVATPADPGLWERTQKSGAASRLPGSKAEADAAIGIVLRSTRAPR